MRRKLIIVYADGNIAHIKHRPPPPIGLKKQQIIHLRNSLQISFTCRPDKSQKDLRLVPIIVVVCIISKLTSL